MEEVWEFYAEFCIYSWFVNVYEAKKKCDLYESEGIKKLLIAAYYASAWIRINAIAPGFMVNERNKKYLGTVKYGLTKRGENVIKHTPMGRFGEARDLVGCVKWLPDREVSEFVTGTVIPIDGGFLTLGCV